ncbi:Nitroreductase [Desulfuromusa kysingii]|uniref:Nitroreductase n=1 Tax=Desulfuromusa kysingii TaxID=37625 RepID=A0A1H4C715_9BACT|nr:nitroreductase family protein [Desulfuromusa kysingii]SEA56174.1 Nitroreductase [Desulfuromusa kysingii]
MELKDVVIERHSVRRYTDKSVSVETIKQIVDLAKNSPSWANYQPIRYNCILNKEIKAKLSETSDYNRRYLARSSAVIVISAVLNLSGADSSGTVYYHTSKEWTMFDAGIASYGFCLAAQDVGVGSVILGDFDGTAVRELIDLPTDEDVIALIAIGYPENNPHGPERKPTSKLLRFLK